MPQRNKRHYIKPGTGTKFRLVNRSIRDLGGYELGAGGNVLAPIEECYDDLEIDDIKEIERDHGVNYKDNYNYMQHMKQRSAEATCWMSADGRSVISVAPSRASSRISRLSRVSRAQSHISASNPAFFESDAELPPGYFQDLQADKDAMPLDWDPEIAAQLDGLDGDVVENPPEEDEDYDDFDNIVAMANEGASDEEAEMDEFDRDFGTGERIGDTDHSFVMDRFLGDRGDDEIMEQHLAQQSGDRDIDDRSLENDIDDRMSTGSERKTRFTSYSMTSSIMRRSEKLVNLDDQFEEMFLGKYDDDRVGDLQHENLDDNEVELDSALLANAIQTDYAQFVPGHQTVMDTIKGDKDLKQQALDFVENYNSDEDEANVEIVELKEKPKWDCETIISTYSNLYNRPKVVDDGFSTKSGAINVKKLQAGSKVVRTTTSEFKQMEQEYQEERGEMKLRVQKREKDETKEAKKARKSAVKAAKRDRRVEKKETRAAFAAEFATECKRKGQDAIRLN